MMTGFDEEYEPYRQGIRPARETPITPRQQDVLNYVTGHIELYGFAPAHRQISRHFGLKSSRSAAIHLRELEAKGAIEIQRGIARAIRVLA